MMMLNKNDQERVTQLLTDAITVLCRNGLSYQSQFCIEGLLGITIDDSEVFLVKIDESVKGHGQQPSDIERTAPNSMPQRTAMTSPRMRGRTKGKVLSPGRGKFTALGGRKRNLFVGTARPPGSNASNVQSAVSDGGGEPPSKVRLQGETSPNTTPVHDEDNVIEIGEDDQDDDVNDTVPLERNDSDIKTEPPDFNTMPADSTQGPDSKYTLDNETSKNLNDFLDNLMTAHGTAADGGGSSSQSASSSSPMATVSGSGGTPSQLSQMTSPKKEPPSWDEQQYGSPGIHGSSPATQQQQTMPYGRAAMIKPERFSSGGGSSYTQRQQSSPLRTTQRLSHYPSTPRQYLKPRHSPGQFPRTLKSVSPGISVMDNTSMALYTQQMTSGENAAAFSAPTAGSADKYSCPKCGKTFKEKYHFFGHMNSHLNVRPYTCKKCGKGFSYSNSLSRHKRTCGAAEVGHKCDICQQSFGSVNALQMHLLQTHGSTY